MKWDIFGGSELSTSEEKMLNLMVMEVPLNKMSITLQEIITVTTRRSDGKKIWYNPLGSGTPKGT